MAAARVDVFRRSDVGRLNRGQCHAYPDENGYNFPSSRHRLASQKNNRRELNLRRCELDVTLKEGRTCSLNDGDKQPPQKKRKSSPIECAIKEKQVRVSSRNRVLSSSSTLLSPVSDVGLSPSLSPQQFQDVELEQVSAGEVVQAPNILTSRWASDSDDEDVAQKEKNSRSSSLESGEFKIEDLEGDCMVSNHSNERSISGLSTCENMQFKADCDSAMEFDGMDEEDVADESESYAEEPTGRCCRSVFDYERLNKISEGTYGIVYRARDKKTGEIVALKKVKILNQREAEEYGFPLTSLREINILASFNHPSIVKVKEVVVDDHGNVYIVMEYMEHDFKELMESMKQPFSTSEVKCLMLQLLEGVKYLHNNWVLHRDLKTSNLLMNNQGDLKICDFGMARQYGSPLKPYTTKVVTQWYRAPELLLGAKTYSTAIDMWSVGCIMAELLAKEPLFRGTSEIDQIKKIFDTLGTPNEKIWPGFSELPGAKANYSRQQHNLLRKKFPVASFTGSAVLSDTGLDLLNRLLSYNPEKRITADDALNHAWFHECPFPKSKEFLPTFPPKV